MALFFSAVLFPLAVANTNRGSDLKMQRSLLNLRTLREYIDVKLLFIFDCFKCMLVEGYIPSNYGQMMPFKTSRLKQNL